MLGLIMGAVLTVPAWSFAQFSSDDSPRRGDDAVEAEDTAFCYNEFETDAVNSAYWDDHYVPCFSRWDACKSSFVLDVGDSRVGKIGGSYYSTPDAYYESGECGWASPIHQTSGDLYVFVGNAIAVNFNCSGTGDLTTYIDLFVEERVDVDCTGTILRSWRDQQDCTVMCLDDSGYRHQAAYGIGDCAANEAGEATWSNVCHMPDVLIPNLANGRWYKYMIYTGIFVGGSWQHNAVQTGCFRAVA
jgi:hypothetical protein